jgi:hypothetical protein
MAGNFVKGTSQDTPIVFVNTSKEVKRAMENLAKKALRRGGKVVREILQENVPVRSSRLKNHIQTSVKINRDGQPQMKVGFWSWQRVKKSGKLPSHASPHWIEFGTSQHVIKINTAGAMGYSAGNADYFFGKSVMHPGMQATHVLRNTVYDHIKEIKAAQEELLAQLTEMSDAAIANMEAEPDDEDDND